MILACGEALIDMLPRLSQAGEPSFAPYAGGAVFNTAIALGRLGAPAGFFSGLSSDLFGDLLRQVLEQSHVDVSPAHVSDLPTTLAFVRLTDGHASYTFYDENTAGRMLLPEHLPTVEAQALFFGGISLVGEPCGTAYEALQAREAGRRVTMVDPNIRPTFIRDEAAYRARLGRMIGRADIVKVSDEDLHWIMGAGDVTDLAQKMLRQGPKIVCVTEGAKGATGHTAQGKVHVPAQKVTVADTVGAGDTFNAGFLAALWQSECLTKAAVRTISDDVLAAAIGLGVRAAAVTVSRPGANPPWAHEL